MENDNMLSGNLADILKEFVHLHVDYPDCILFVSREWSMAVQSNTRWIFVLSTTCLNAWFIIATIVCNYGLDFDRSGYILLYV